MDINCALFISTGGQLYLEERQEYQKHKGGLYHLPFMKKYEILIQIKRTVELDAGNLHKQLLTILNDNSLS
ncbi:hypothetical protein FHS19_001685 [Paenibacillus rhizosphaerae]|uniref:Uncharacterized protein n=1 Tax=Paenibacillus rhizosphaerae TaxID=297318 RepID=A0A839TK43_9BACL|nr:hypothetical protein [Paenibacillus rhizosphaerae]